MCRKHDRNEAIVWIINLFLKLLVFYILDVHTNHVYMRMLIVPIIKSLIRQLPDPICGKNIMIILVL